MTVLWLVLHFQQVLMMITAFSPYELSIRAVKLWLT